MTSFGQRGALDRAAALELLKRYVKNDRLVKHAIAVEAIMRGLARRLGEDEEVWGVVGLLHDVDYELVGGDMKRHGLLSAEIVSSFLPEEALDAVRAHNEMTGFKSDSRLATALKAADHLAGLIVATALVMPNKKLAEVRVKSVAKKYKQKDFARSIDRARIALCESIGVPLEEFFAIGLEALRSVSGELGL